MSLPVPTALLYTWIVCDAFILAFLKSIWYISKFSKLVLLTLKNCTIIISFHEAGWSASKHFYQFVEVKINQLLKRNRFVYAIFTFWYCVLESSSVSLNLKEFFESFVFDGKRPKTFTCKWNVRACNYVLLLFANLILDSRLHNIFKILCTCSFALLEKSNLANLFLENSQALLLIWGFEIDCVMNCIHELWIINHVCSKYRLRGVWIFHGHPRCLLHHTSLRWLHANNLLVNIVSRLLVSWNTDKERFEE